MPPKRKSARKSAETKSTRGTTKALQEEQINPSTLTVVKLKEALEEKGLCISTFQLFAIRLLISFSKLAYLFIYSRIGYFW